MVIYYKKCVFRVEESGKLGRRSIKFLGYSENFKEMVSKYKPSYPTESFREFGVGQGVPSYMIQDIKDNEECKLILNQIERDDKIDDLLENTIEEGESNLLPIVRRVFAQTIALDLVEVKPMGFVSDEKLRLVKERVLSENRDSVVNSLLKGGKIKVKILEEDPEYIEMTKNNLPKGELMYLDFKYGDASTLIHYQSQMGDNKNNK